MARLKYTKPRGEKHTVDYSSSFTPDDNDGRVARNMCTLTLWLGVYDVYDVYEGIRQYDP